MSVTWRATMALHPRVILAIAIKRAQGLMISTEILPERPVTNRVFEYREYGQTDREIGGMAPKVEEGDTTPLDKLTYEVRVKRCDEVREGTLISEQAQKFLFRDVVRDHVTYITDRIALRQESMAFDEITERTSTTGQLKGATTLASTYEWDGANGSVLDNFANAKKFLRDQGHVIPTDVILGTDGENKILKATELRNWSYAGPFGQKPITEGSIGRVFGLDVWVTDSVKLSNENDPTSGLIPILQDKAIVLRRGPDLGMTAVAEPFTSRRIPIPNRRGVMLQMFKTFLPVVQRPRRIYIINNISSDLTEATKLVAY